MDTKTGLVLGARVPGQGTVGDAAEPLNILIVTADDGLAQRVAARLEADGQGKHRIIHLHCLADALIEVVVTPIDAILLDFWLPDSKGLETVITMVRGARAIPVIVLSGAGEEGLVQDSFRYGVRDYFQKTALAYTFLLGRIQIAIERHIYCQSVDQRSRELELERVRYRRQDHDPAPAQDHLEAA